MPEAHISGCDLVDISATRPPSLKDSTNDSKPRFLSNCVPRHLLLLDRRYPPADSKFHDTSHNAITSNDQRDMAERGSARRDCSNTYISARIAFGAGSRTEPNRNPLEGHLQRARSVICDGKGRLGKYQGPFSNQDRSRLALFSSLEFSFSVLGGGFAHLLTGEPVPAIKRKPRPLPTLSQPKEHGPDTDCDFRNSSQRSANSYGKPRHGSPDRRFECLVRDQSKPGRSSRWQFDPRLP